MKQNKIKLRLISAIMLVVLVASLVCAIPVSVFAALSVASDMTVISDVETTLAPGVTQNETVIYDRNGKRVELFVATADLNVDTVGVQSSYVGAQCVNHGMAKMTEQVAAHQAKYEARGEQYTAIVGMNGSYYNMTTGQPAGAFYMEGVNGNGSNPNSHPFFAILKDGTPYIGRAGDYESVKNQIWEAVGANEVLVWEGQSTYKQEDNAKYPRSAVGITADGKVVFINANGNQTKSAGLTRYELAQLLVEKGCVAAVKYDEGGSATYVTKPQGSNNYVVTNTPSDGGERPVSTGLIIYSTAKGDGEFDTAVLTPEYNYVTPESVVTVSAIGADAVGGAAEIPADISWSLSNGSMGTVADGVFTSNGTVGAAIIQMMYKGEVVGQTTVNVVIPEIAFANDNTVVPYGKTVPLSVNATYNMIPVALKDGDVTYSLSDPTLGTITNGEFTACDVSTGLTSGALTATLKYDEDITASTTLVFGKGSEVLMDFEDSVDSDFTMRSFYYDRNGASGATGPAGRQEMGEAWVVDKNTGEVRNGEKALAVNVDNSWGTAAGGYSVMLHFDPVDITGATYVGMWMYIPVKEMSKIQVTLYQKSTITCPDATITGSSGVTMFTYQGFKNANVSPNEDGWYYFRVPVSGLTQISAMAFSTTDSNNTIWNPYDDFVFYIDDITADYSDAVEDRENPVFSDIYISETADSKVAMNGQTITQNTITVVAPAADNTQMINYTGLNISSAKVYVDGFEVAKGVTCSNEGNIMLDGITLSNGTHTFRFEICDNAGNMGAIERQVVVNQANGNIYLEAPNTALVPLGSVQYFKLMAKNIEDVQSVTATIDLDSISHWELKGMEVPYGFTSEYSINEDFNTATITITRTGEIEVSGETALAIMPVRTWEPLGWKNSHFIDLGVVSKNPGQVDSYKMMTPYGMWMSDGTRMYRIEMQIDSGIVTYTDATTDTFTSDEKHILTEMNRYRADGHYDANWNWVKEDPNTSDKEHRQGKISNHIHIAGTAQNKEATCTTAGYIGRIFCVGCDCGAIENVHNATADAACQGHGGACGSVIDWGTIIPANGHNYTVVGGVLKCECGKVFNGEYTDGKTYVDGIVVEGWNTDNTKYYLDGIALTGVNLVDGFYLDFGNDGVFSGKYTGKFYNKTSGGYSYAIAGDLQNGWHLIDGTWNYFRWDEKTAITGTYKFINGDCAGITYVFDNEGNLTDGVWHTTEDGKIQYFYGPDCHRWANNTLEEIDGKTYCFDKDGYLYLGYQVLQVGYNQPTWLYHFDNVTGELIKIYNQESGIYSLHNGNYCYLVNGVVQKSLGMITVDGAQYYVRGNGLVAVGKYYVGAGYTGCGHLKAGYYDFGEDGKFVGPWIDKSLNGVQTGDDGELHYYVNGVVQKSLGMITVDGAQYYVRGNGLVAVGKYYVGAGYTGCGHLKPGYYDFGEDGKFIGPWIDENAFTGIKADAEGDLHYYVNDIIQKSLGMITVDGAQYYVRGNGLVAVG
ncbi:MAG: phosphodiester glycosidase family protein, partial [Clostridia bacterium]|nr:phosphodiester glycosidase family protein [Clostridia bacterium]